MNTNHTAKWGWLALAMALISPPGHTEPEVLRRSGEGVEAGWGPLKFEELDDKPDTLAGYGILDALGGDAAIVRTFAWYGDTAPVATGEGATLFWANAGEVRGMECDVLTAPRGGDLVMDLLIGNPPVSVYDPAARPKIWAGETSTLDHLPEALAARVPIAKRDKLQVKIISAPVPNYTSSLATVGELPIEPQIGTRILVLSDGHVWEGRDYGISYTDQGLVSGLTGAVAAVVNLPTEAAEGAKYLVDADDHVYTRNADTTWTDSGTLDNTGIWTSNTAATVADLTWPTPAGSTFLTLNDGHLWRNDYAIWTDIGLPDSSGLGLRCNVYVYNLPNDD